MADAAARKIENNRALRSAGMNGELENIKKLCAMDDIDVNCQDDEGRTPLIMACWFHKAESVRYLCGVGEVDVNLTTNEGRTALYYSCTENTPNIARILCATHDIDVNISSKENSTPLHVACEEGNSSIVKSLCAIDGILVDVQKKDLYTPLHLAALKGSSDIVKILCDMRADVTLKAGDGKTAIRLAAEKGHYKTVSILSGLSPLDNTFRDERGMSFLHIACKYNFHEFAARLCEAGGFGFAVNLKDKEGKTSLRYASELGRHEIVQIICGVPGIKVNLGDKYGRSALHDACEKGHYEVVKILCEIEDIEVNLQDNEGTTPLRDATNQGHHKIVQMLCGVRDIDMDLKDKVGRSALHSACRKGYSDVVKTLCEIEDTVVNLQDENGRTPLHFSCENGHLEATRILCAIPGIDVTLKDRRTMTPSNYAAQNGHSKIVQMLAEMGDVDVTFQDKNGKSFLHIACEKGHYEFAKMLCKMHKIEINLKDKDGKSSLHSASENGHHEIVKIICEMKDIDINLQDKDGKSSLHSASENGHHEIVKILCEMKDININLRDKNETTPLRYACDKGHLDVVQTLYGTGQAEVNFRDKNGKSCLHSACQKGHQELVKLLCEMKDIDINLQDKKLYRCREESGVAYRRSKDREDRVPNDIGPSHNDVIEVIKEDGEWFHCSNGYFVPVQSDDKDMFELLNVGGMTPLGYACDEGHRRIVQILCETGRVEVNLQDKEGKSVLHIACERNYHETVKLLCGIEETDFNLQDQTGNTPLFLACMHGHDAVVEVLCDTGRIDWSDHDKYGITYLAVACEKGHYEVARLLLRMNQFQKGHSVLRDACESGDSLVVRVLCESKQFDINLQDKTGSSVLHFACDKGHIDVIKVLCESTQVDINLLNQNEETPLELLLHRRPENTVVSEVLQSLTKVLSFELVVQKRNDVLTLFDLLLDNYGYASKDCIEVLGIEEFTFSQSMFLNYHELLNIRQFAGGEYGALYKAEINISRKLDMNKVERNKLTEEDWKRTDILIPVVCKISKSGAGANEWFELQVLQNLPRHKNVVGLLAMCTGFKNNEDAALYTALLMNYKSGGSLLDELKKQRDGSKDFHHFDLKYLCKFGLDIVNAVAHMHRYSYKHCDIAARNFLRGKHYADTVICITDFGLSRPFADQHNLDTKIPYRWCAPETLRTGRTSPWSDMWMVGITLSELCTYPYRSPFPNFIARLGYNNVTSFLEYLTAGNRYHWALYRKRIPAKWLELCDWCCSISAKERPSPEELSDRMNDILETVEQEENANIEENVDAGIESEELSGPDEVAPEFYEDADYMPSEYAGVDYSGSDEPDKELEEDTYIPRVDGDSKLGEDVPSHIDKNNPQADASISIPEEKHSSKTNIYVSNLILEHKGVIEELTLQTKHLTVQFVAQSEKMAEQTLQTKHLTAQLVAQSEKMVEQTLQTNHLTAQLVSQSEQMAEQDRHFTKQLAVQNDSLILLAKLLSEKFAE